MLHYCITEEEGYYEDLYPKPIDDFTDELLNVVVDNASDEETSEVGWCLNYVCLFLLIQQKGY